MRPRIVDLQSSPLMIHPSVNSLLHPDLPLNLLMETGQSPHLIPLENILPRTRCIPPTQNILMNTPLQTTSQHSRPPLPISRNLQLHPSPNRLADSKGATESFHLEAVLRFFPFLKTAFQWVR